MHIRMVQYYCVTLAGKQISVHRPVIPACSNLNWHLKDVLQPIFFLFGFYFYFVRVVHRTESSSRQAVLTFSFIELNPLCFCCSSNALSAVSGLIHICMVLVWLHSQFLEYVLTHSYLHGASMAALLVSGVCFDSFIFASCWCGCTHSFWSMFLLIHICMELVWLHSQFLEYVLTHSYLHGAGVAALIVSGVCFAHSYLHGAGMAALIVSGVYFDSFIFAWSWYGCTHSFWSIFWLIHICMELVWLHS